MSQREFLQALDAEIVTTLVGASMGDDATYRAGGVGAGVPVQVLVDRAAAFLGAMGDVAGTRVTVDLFLAQVPSPQRGDTLTIGTEVLKLDQLDARDESLSRWVVVDG